MEPSIIIASAALFGLAVVVAGLLRAWEGWLAFKRQELLALEKVESVAGPGKGRIEIADLRERIRKLEAIANGMDL